MDDYSSRRKKILELLDWIMESAAAQGWTHGPKLGASDCILEDVLLLEEIKAVLTPEQWKDFLRGEIMATNPNNTQVGGTHYRESNPSFQHWDLVVAYNMNYFIGNMTKYVCRWRKKNGLADLEKAKHYLDKLCDIHSRGLLPTGPLLEYSVNLTLARQFCEDQKLSQLETEIIMHSVCYFHPGDLLYIQSQLEELIKEAEKHV